MVLVAFWLVRRFAPEAGGSGIQEIEGVIITAERTAGLNTQSAEY